MAIFHTRQRRALASITLGCWLFAFFVGVAHACGLGGGVGHSLPAVTALSDGPGQSGDDAVPGCKQFCDHNLPVSAKLPLSVDQLGEQALLLPPSIGEPLLATPRLAQSPVHWLHPPPGIAVNTRFVRLVL